jgi:FMN-dependent NADH-azoreductase
MAAGLNEDTIFDYANAIASADMIVIAAPYWNMSFPASLSVFLELASVEGITYTYGEDGTPIGLSQASDMYYVTTSGGIIGNCNFGFEYINALFRLYGIQNTHFVSAQGLDLEGANVQEILEKACTGEIENFHT